MEINSVCVSVGDEVLFQWGDQIIFDGEEYFIVREGEISAVVKGN
jgi:co-chaperonin GroES (HSP10)